MTDYNEPALGFAVGSAEGTNRQAAVFVTKFSMHYTLNYHDVQPVWHRVAVRSTWEHDGIIGVSLDCRLEHGRFKADVSVAFRDMTSVQAELKGSGNLSWRTIKGPVRMPVSD